MLKGDNSGFTFIEIIALMAIVGILAFVLITQSPLEPAKLTAARAKLINDIRYVQSMAYNQGGNFEIVFFPDQERYEIHDCRSGIPIQIPDPVDRSASYEVNYSTDIEYSGVDLVNANFSGEQVLIFDWQGIPRSSAMPLTFEGTVVLQNSSGSVTIRVNPETGRVRY